MSSETTTVRLSGSLTHEGAVRTLTALLRGADPEAQRTLGAALHTLERLAPGRDHIKVRAFLLSAVRLAVARGPVQP